MRPFDWWVINAGGDMVRMVFTCYRILQKLYRKTDFTFAMVANIPRIQLLIAHSAAQIANHSDNKYKIEVDSIEQERKYIMRWVFSVS